MSNKILIHEDLLDHWVVDMDPNDLDPQCVAQYNPYKHRWYTSYSVVFFYQDKYWLTQYMEPASEMQDRQDRWCTDDDGMVELVEVVPKKKMVETIEYTVVD